MPKKQPPKKQPPKKQQQKELQQKEEQLAKTLTRADLAEAVYRQIGLSRAEAAGLVETVMARISTAAAEGQNVKLSSFGTFVIRSKKERIGRNPKTGEEVPITPRKVMTFKPSNIMKRRINGEEAGEDDGED